MTAAVDFDEDTVDTYTTSECWALAWSLYTLTGWPPVAIIGVSGLGWAWRHVAVRRPDGILVDINGAATEAEMLDLWRYELDDPDSARIVDLPTDRDAYSDAVGYPFNWAVNPDRDRRIAGILAEIFAAS